MPDAKYKDKSAILRSIAKNKNLRRDLLKAAVSKPGTSKNKKAQAAFRALNRAAGIDGQGGTPVAPPIQPTQPGSQAPQQAAAKQPAQPVQPVPVKPPVGIVRTFGSGKDSLAWLRGGPVGINVPPTPPLEQALTFGVPDEASQLYESGISKLTDKTKPWVTTRLPGAVEIAAAAGKTIGANILPALTAASSLLAGVGQTFIGQAMGPVGEPTSWDAWVELQRLRSGLTPTAAQPTKGTSQTASTELAGSAAQPEVSGQTQVTGKSGKTQQDADNLFYDKVQNQKISAEEAQNQVYNETGLYPVDHWNFLPTGSQTGDAASLINTYFTYGTAAGDSLYNSLPTDQQARLKTLQAMVKSAPKGVTVDYFLAQPAELAKLLGLDESMVPHIATETPTAKVKDMVDKLKLSYGLDAQFRQLQDSEAAASALPLYLTDYIRAKDVSMKMINQEIDSLLDEQMAAPGKDANPVVAEMRRKVLGAWELTRSNLSKTYIDAMIDSVTEYDNRVKSMTDEYSARVSQFEAEATALAKGIEEQGVMDKERLAKYEKNVGDLYDMLKWGTTTDDMAFQYSSQALDKQASDIAYSFSRAANTGSTTKKPSLDDIVKVFTTPVERTIAGKKTAYRDLKFYRPSDVISEATFAGYGDILPQVLREFSNEINTQIADPENGPRVLSRFIPELVEDLGGMETVQKLLSGQFDNDATEAKAQILDVMFSGLVKSVRSSLSAKPIGSVSAADVNKIFKQLNSGKTGLFGGSEADFVSQWGDEMGETTASQVWREAETLRMSGSPTPFGGEPSLDSLLQLLAEISVKNLLLGDTTAYQTESMPADNQ